MEFICKLTQDVQIFNCKCKLLFLRHQHQHRHLHRTHWKLPMEFKKTNKGPSYFLIWNFSIILFENNTMVDGGEVYSEYFFLFIETFDAFSNYRYYILSQIYLKGSVFFLFFFFVFSVFSSFSNRIRYWQRKFSHRKSNLITGERWCSVSK